jgi:nucleoside-diphosphate-sugar epimerase
MSAEERVLVTGANGFVGRTLCSQLVDSGYKVRAALRSDHALTGVTDKCIVGNIDDSTQWDAALDGVDCVIHLAARVHVLADSPANAEAYARVNALGTRRLAQSLAAAGGRRFVYLSSIKVNGEQTYAHPFTAADAPQPQDAYGVSKLEGERLAMEAVTGSQTDCVIVRPPLVYGPGVRANFLRLMRWVDRKLPLPLRSVDNARSLVSVWNLCDLITTTLVSPAAASRVWMASDGEDLSTPELIRRLARAMGRPVRLLPMPVALLRAAGALLGRGPEISRLCGSLAVDITPARRDLRWSPPVSVDESLARTVSWFLSNRFQQNI